MLKRKHLKCIYILSMMIALSTKLPFFSLPWYIPYFYCALWIFFGLIATKNVQYRSTQEQKVVLLLRGFLENYFIFWVFSIPAYLINFGTTQLHYASRAISTTIQAGLIFYAAYFAYLILGEESFHCTFRAIVYEFIVVIILTVIKYGLLDTIKVGLVPFGKEAEIWRAEGNPSTALEQHDIGFSIVFFLIYFLFWKDDKGKRNYKGILLSLIIIYLTYKRIGVAGGILALICLFFFKKTNHKSIRRWSAFLTIGVTLICFLYVYLIDSNLLGILAQKYEIDFMGRLDIYTYMSQFFEFSPLYFGRGFSAGSIINGSAMLLNGKLISGHSDILFKYIDFGFWGMLAWICWNCFVFPGKVERRYGAQTAKIWIVFTIYAFVTYLTDNTFGYFAFNTCYFVVVAHSIENGKELIGEREK